MYSNSTYKDFNIDTSKTFQDIGNNEDLANVSIAQADEELVKCLICMKVIKNVNDMSIVCHFKSTHNIMYELPLLKRMTVAVGIEIKIEKINKNDDIEVHIPLLRKKPAFGCSSGDCCDNPRYLVDKNTGTIVQEDNLAPLYNWCDNRRAENGDIPEVLQEYINVYNSLSSNTRSVIKPPSQYLQEDYKCPHCGFIFENGIPGNSISNHYAMNHIETLLNGYFIDKPLTSTTPPVRRKRCKKCAEHCPPQENIQLSQTYTQISTSTLEMRDTLYYNDDNYANTEMENRVQNKNGSNDSNIKSVKKKDRIYETIHKPNKSFKCKECKYITAIKCNFVKHQKTHGISKRCMQCTKMFKTDGAFIEHVAMAHKKYNCNICQKSFKHIIPLKAHQRKNHK